MFESLSGFSVGVTADRRSSEQIQMLEGRGARCVHGPMLRSHQMHAEADIHVPTSVLIAKSPDITVLTTGTGVRAWFSVADSLEVGDELRASLVSSEIYARGAKATGAAVAVGLDVFWNGAEATTDDIVSELARVGVAGKRIAVQCDGDPTGSLGERLVVLGAEVIDVAVYQWARPDDGGPALHLIRAVSDGQIDALTFTARPAVENFAAIASEMGVWEDVISSGTAIFAVGKLTGAAVAECGLGVPHIPDRPSLGNLVMHLTRTMSGDAFAADLAGHAVMLRGRMVTIDGSGPTMLSGRERRVFEVLLARPGVVHSKAALLNSVWGDETPDPHVVEVTIGRLRARLGTAGEGIETVVRRGYRVSPV